MFFCKNTPFLQTWQRLLCICGSLILVFLIYKHLTDDRNRKYDSGYISVPLTALMSGKPHVLSQDDNRITNYIWDHEYIQNPSLEPYNLENPDEDPMGQGQFIRKIFQNKTGGFFVEVGALDGETNTLSLEKQLGWTGLIIEPDPKNYDILRRKNRKAWTSNTCLATKTKPYPHKVVLDQVFNVGRISEEQTKDFQDNPKHRHSNVVRFPLLKTMQVVFKQTFNAGQIFDKQPKDFNHTVVQCFPLFSLLSALQVSVVDYFSLDVEGAELDVLQNVAFDKVFIKVMTVKFNHVQRKETLEKFLEEKGYISVGEVIHPVGYGNDFIFIHNSLHSTISAFEQSK